MDFMRSYDPDEGRSVQLKKDVERAEYIVFVFICNMLHTSFWRRSLFSACLQFIEGSNSTQHKLFFEHFFSTYDLPVYEVRGSLLYYPLIDWLIYACIHAWCRHVSVCMCVSLCLYLLILSFIKFLNFFFLRSCKQLWKFFWNYRGFQGV